MHILLQNDPVGYSDLYWLAGAAVVLVIAYFWTKKIVADRADQDVKNYDPRSHVINDSNYNIAHEGVDKHRTEGLSKEGAEEVIDKLKKSRTMPSREEFHELRKDIK